MTISKKPNYKHAYAIANESLIKSNSLASFPFKVKKFVEERSGIAVRTFSKALKYGINISDFGSDSAMLIEFCGEYIIFYNQDEPDYRIRFSILHEFGHYIFQHVRGLPASDPIYGIQELEANFFAAQMLMPEQILRECARREKRLTPDFIAQAFGVSSEAAEKRIRTLSRTRAEWHSKEEKEFDDLILLKYATFLDQIAPRNLFGYFDDEERQRERDSWFSSRRNFYQPRR